MKYLDSIFEDINSFFVINREEYNRYIESPIIYNFFESEMKQISNFLDKKKANYKWTSCTLHYNYIGSSADKGIFLNDKDGLYLKYNDDITLHIDGKTTIIKNHPFIQTIKIENFSLVIDLLEPFSQNFYINKSYDEWFLIEDLSELSRIIKCDQMHGLLEFLENDSFKFSNVVE